MLIIEGAELTQIFLEAASLLNRPGRNPTPFFATVVLILQLSSLWDIIAQYFGTHYYNNLLLIHVKRKHLYLRVSFISTKVTADHPFSFL